MALCHARFIPTMQILSVDAAEQGMKLLSFLSRHLESGVPMGDIHRWIRTGQVRVNGARAKAFDRLQTADAVRIPPFAISMVKHEQRLSNRAVPGMDIGCGVVVLATYDDFLGLEKPAGIPTQPGTGHQNSVSTVLRAFFSGAAYIPAPAHRLDKATSGLILAGKTHDAQERLHALFAAPHSGETMNKRYLTWVSGTWPHTREILLTDRICKTADAEGHERVRVLSSEEDMEGKEARSQARLLEVRETSMGAVSLLQMTLETGRTHQIRVQLSSRGFPVIGDGKYGGIAFSQMLLHAQSLSFPWRGEQVTLILPPKWPAPFTVAE